MEQKPALGNAEKEPKTGQEQCAHGDHAWVAVFLASGRLAYWQCEVCGLADRETDPLPERLAIINDWIELPPRLTARGSQPPSSTRRWATTQATILCEGDPSSIHHVGLRIPDLAEAYTYVERDEDGSIHAIYEPCRVRHSLYGDHYTLTRYQVVGCELVRFRSHCFEESTLDVPSTQKPRQSVVLAGLKLLHP